MGLVATVGMHSFSLLNSCICGFLFAVLVLDAQIGKDGRALLLVADFLSTVVMHS
jgi:hypothetical protein